MIKPQHAGEAVERAVLAWANTYSPTHAYSDLACLVDGNFFLEVLSHVPHFTLTDRVPTLPQDAPLAERASRMRAILKSISGYYQCELLRDVSQLHINPIDLCMGSPEEIIRAIILLVGVVEAAGSQQNTQIRLNQLEEEDRKLFAVLMSYARQSGINNCPTSPPPSLDLITTIEQLEFQVEELQQQNSNLQKQIADQKENTREVQAVLAKTQKEQDRLLDKVEFLQSERDKLESQVQAKARRQLSLEEAMTAKEEILKTHVAQLLSEKAQLELKLTLFTSASEQQKQLLEMNEHLQKQVDHQQAKINQLKHSEGELRKELKSQRQKCSQATQQYQAALLQLQAAQLRESLYAAHKPYNPQTPVSNQLGTASLSFFNQSKTRQRDYSSLLASNRERHHREDSPGKQNKDENCEWDRILQNDSIEFEKRERGKGSFEQEVAFLLTVIEKLKGELERKNGELKQRRWEQDKRGRRMLAFRSRVELLFGEEERGNQPRIQ